MQPRPQDEKSDRPAYINQIIFELDEYIRDHAKIAPPGARLIRSDQTMKVFFHFDEHAIEVPAYIIKGGSKNLYTRHEGVSIRKKPLKEEQKKFYASVDRDPGTLARIENFLNVIDRLKEPDVSCAFVKDFILRTAERINNQIDVFFPPPPRKLFGNSCNMFPDSKKLPANVVVAFCQEIAKTNEDKQLAQPSQPLSPQWLRLSSWSSPCF